MLCRSQLILVEMCIRDRGISGSLSSLAGGLLPGVGCDAICEECVTIPFDAAVSADKTLVTGSLLAFGHCPSVQNRHRLTVYAVLADQSRWYYTYDVTDQIHSAPNQRDVHIVLDGLPLPKPIVNGGGFQPTVDEWQEVPCLLYTSIRKSLHIIFP